MNSDHTEWKMTEQELKGAFVNMLSGKMAKADWYYEYSDDSSVWKKGTQEIGDIKEDLKLLSRLDGGLDEAKKLWARHVPPYSILEPVFFSNPKVLDSILDGMLMREDAPAVQKILQEQQNAGNRFVAFDSSALVLPNNRFTGFTSALEAKHFAYEKSTLEETYEVRSIADIQKEVQRALEPAKEHAIKAAAERLQRHPPEDKRSRGQEMSR